MPTATAQHEVTTLDIGGMSCGACAARIEKVLNKLTGVTAQVNFATEQARVEHPPTVPVDRLIQAVEEAGYTATVPAPPAAQEPAEPERGSTDPERDALRHRLIGGALLAAPVIVLAMVTPWQFRYWQWFSLMLAAPVATWAAWPFHRAAWKAARHGTATMDTLISLGVLAAFGWSLYTLFFGYAGYADMRMPFTLHPVPGLGLHHIYLEVAAGLTVFILAGRNIEHRAKRRAGSALRALTELGAKDVAVLRNGEEVRVPIGELRVGETFVVRPGEKVATDGIVVDGTSALDVSLLTGESTPVEVSAGDRVIGASINASGRLLVRATKIGADTQLAQITRLVADAQAGKAPVQRLADRIAGIFVPVVIGLAVATFGGWLGATGDIELAFTAAVSVLVVACPCSLGLATPTALMVGTGRGAQLGILIKGVQVLESTRRVDTVVLDKTGTVTAGRMRLQRTVTRDGVDPAEALRLAGAVEDASEHPIAKVVAAAARAAGPLPPITEFTSVQGRGVRATVSGRTVAVGRADWVADGDDALPPLLAATVRYAELDGHTAVMAGWDGAVQAVFVVADELKGGSAEAVRELQHMGLRTVLLSGDSAAAARAVAKAVAIDEVIAGVLPASKLDVVKRLQDDGHVVAMVGDGVNDAAALAQADLGIAMGAGTDVAIEASDLTIVGGDLRAVPQAIRLARRTLAIIKGNLFWAFVYNVAALPLAVLGLLNPMIAAVAMACSSIFVVSNSLRLMRFARKQPSPSAST